MAQMPYGPVPTALPPWTPGGPPPGTSPRLKAAVIALAVITLLALGLAAAAWFRAAPTPMSAQNVDQARAAVCAAHNDVKQALAAATNQPEAKEPGNTLLIAVNIRLAEYSGADYLSQALAANPAAPQALAEQVGSLVDALRQLAIGQLGDAPKDSLQPLTDEIGALTDEISQKCGGQI
jgi:hypothetical protein